MGKENRIQNVKSKITPESHLEGGALTAILDRLTPESPSTFKNI